MFGSKKSGKMVLLWLLAALFVASGPAGTPSARAKRVHAKKNKEIIATARKNIVITRSELEAAIEHYEANRGNDKLSKAEVAGILENLIRRKLLLQVPAVNKYRRDPAVVAKVRDYEDTQIVARWVAEKIRAKARVSEKELEAYYEKNRQQFRTPPSVKASYILLRTRGDAEMVLKKLHKGAGFAGLAKQYSIDLPTGRQGGLIGTISESKNPSTLGKVLFLLAPGETSGIISTKAGYAIFKADAIYPPGFKPYEVVRNSIKDRLLRDKARDSFRQIVQNLEENAGIKIFKDRLAAFEQASGRAPAKTVQHRAAIGPRSGK